MFGLNDMIGQKEIMGIQDTPDPQMDKSIPKYMLTMPFS